MSKSNLNRRDFIYRSAAGLSIGVSSAWLALAPPDWLFSRRDPVGLRSIPPEEKIVLPDFSIEADDVRVAVGIGRGGSPQLILRKSIDAIGGIQRFIKKDDVVLIKPNVAFDRSPIMGATTNPEVLKELIRMVLVDARAAEVRVADNPIESAADCFEKSGIRRAVEEAGGSVFLPDSNAFENLYTQNADLIETWPMFNRPFKNVNKVIGIAPVKDHNLCSASMSIKNWYGLLGGKRNQFHQAIHEIIADLSIMIKPTLTILDGTRVLMRNGPTGGDPSYVKEQQTIIAGTDQVALDTWAYQHLLEREDDLPAYLDLAEKKGGGSKELKGRTREIV